MDREVLTIPKSETPGHAEELPVRTTTSTATLKFVGVHEFQGKLRKRVEQYFQTTGKPQRDCWQIYLKTAILLSSLAATYLLLVFAAQTWWQVMPLAVLLGMLMSGIGFNVQHDASHHALSSRPWINKVLSWSLDLLGGSSYVWAWKHNTVHHTYANITGHDDDINISPFGRMSPHQPRFSFHRLQHIYLWFLYGVLPIKWQLYDDFRDVALGRIGSHRFPRPKGGDLAVFLGGKAIFFTLAFVIPMMYHSVGTVLLTYLLTSLSQGVVLSTVFQLAHCVEEASFPMPSQTTGHMEANWAVHQVETTVNFARKNWLLSWYVGGLNYQIEHHLFPRICHVNYPDLSKIVEETARECGVSYTAHTTLRAGLRSHYRWLRRMGLPTK